MKCAMALFEFLAAGLRARCDWAEKLHVAYERAIK